MEQNLISHVSHTFHNGYIIKTQCTFNVINSQTLFFSLHYYFFFLLMYAIYLFRFHKKLAKVNCLFCACAHTIKELFGNACCFLLVLKPNLNKAASATMHYLTIIHIIYCLLQYMKCISTIHILNSRL